MTNEQSLFPSILHVRMRSETVTKILESGRPERIDRAAAALALQEDAFEANHVITTPDKNVAVYGIAALDATVILSVTNLSANEIRTAFANNVPPEITLPEDGASPIPVIVPNTLLIESKSVLEAQHTEQQA
ncbi:MAG TPA: hypothetical protein VLE73_05740 [Candidatus Saccharimonadales bacterium]|nr:hypothetical protein [Candidatus Saccharimonadales bacterium]